MSAAIAGTWNAKTSDNKIYIIKQIKLKLLLYEYQIKFSARKLENDLRLNKYATTTSADYT